MYSIISMPLNATECVTVLSLCWFAPTDVKLLHQRRALGLVILSLMLHVYNINDFQAP